MRKRGTAGYLVMLGVLTYALSIMMPWITVGFGYILGFSFRAYLLLFLFIYPLYTVIRNVPMSHRYGPFCGIIPMGVLVVLYFNLTGQKEVLELTVAKASFGYYTAFIGCILVLVGIFMKLRKQNKDDTVENE